MRGARLLAALLTAAPVVVVAASAAAVADRCAIYEDPLAYNACLARQGPPAANLGGASAPAPRTVPAVAAPARASSRAFYRRPAPAAPYARPRGGRSELVFAPRRK